MVNLARHIVVHAEIHVTGPAVRIIAVVGVKGAGARQDPRRYAAFQSPVDD